jgi:hypothetical protein
VGAGGRNDQALYAHMNNKRKKIVLSILKCSSYSGTSLSLPSSLFIFPQPYLKLLLMSEKCHRFCFSFI